MNVNGKITSHRNIRDVIISRNLPGLSLNSCKHDIDIYIYICKYCINCKQHPRLEFTLAVCNQHHQAYQSNHQTFIINLRNSNHRDHHTSSSPTVIMSHKTTSSRSPLSSCTPDRSPPDVHTRDTPRRVHSHTSPCPRSHPSRCGTTSPTHQPLSMS